MCLFNKHPFRADQMPHTVPEGGTDGCVCHVPDLKGLVQFWGGRHREALSTRPEAGPCQGPEKITA